MALAQLAGLPSFSTERRARLPHTAACTLRAPWAGDRLVEDLRPDQWDLIGADAWLVATAITTFRLR